MLSSESISPPSFYKKRGYGYKRYESSILSPFDNTLLAYSSVPLGSKYKNDREEYDIFIRVPCSYLTIEKQYKVNGQTIFQTNEPVYIDWIECAILIPSESQKLSLIASTRRSLESKHVALYANKMMVFGVDCPVFNWDVSYLLKIKDSKKINHASLLQDQRYNKIKGFVYGYMCGKLKERPSELTESKNHVYSFINLLSGVMNELSHMGNTSNRKPYTEIHEVFDNLKFLGSKISIQLDSNQRTSFDNDLKAIFGMNEDVLRHLKTLKYRGDSNLSVYSIVKKYVKSKERDLYSVKELTDKLLANLKRFINYPSQNGYKQLTIDFDLIQMIIKERLGKIVQLEISNIETETFPFDISPNYSRIKFYLNEISSIDNKYLNIIINEFLSKTDVSTSDEIAQLRKNIIVSVAEKIKKEHNEQITDELAYLRLLHKSMGTVGVGFKPRNTNKNSLQGLAYFLSRYSAIDKLQDYMDKNEFANLRIAYGMWGAAYGFANMSKLFFEPLDFNVDSRNMLYDYFVLLRANMATEEIIVPEDKLIIGSTIQLELTNTKNKKRSKEIEIDQLFKQMIKDNKKINKKEEWIDEIMNCHSEIMKRKGSYPSIIGNDKLLVNDFKGLLTKASKNLSQFGKAKINEATILFLEYLTLLKR